MHARDNLEMAIRAVVQFHNSFPKDYKKTAEGTMLVFVSGKAEIAAFIDILTNLQNRGFTANLYPYAFHADLSYKDKEMLTQYPIQDVDKKGNFTLRRRMLQMQHKTKDGRRKVSFSERKPNLIISSGLRELLSLQPMQLRQESPFKIAFLLWIRAW